MTALPMQMDCGPVGICCRASTRPVLARLWNRPALHAGIPHASHAPPASSSCQQSTRLQSTWHLRGPCIHSRLACRASGTARGSPQGDGEDNNLLYTLGMATLWIGISAYAFLLSPNQTPYRDQIFLRLLVGLRDPGEDFVVNQVYTALFNIMGVFPVIYASLLVPAGRSANKIPAWPFLTASFGLGVFALLPYFTFWRPIKDQQLPPPKEEVEGLHRIVMKGAETPVLPALLIAVTLYEFYMAATAGGDSWGQFGKLLEESRLVHVTTLDFLCLVAFTPFWMYNDAEGRDWAPRDTWLPLLSVVPVLGPAIYLLLRPKTDTSS